MTSTRRRQRRTGRWARRGPTTPEEVARQAPVVLTSLPGPAEVEEVALGPQGLIQGLQPGSVYADLSTGSPTRIRQVAERIEAMGAHMLDAPVSGGTIGAEEGTLAVMVGGDEEVFEAVRPVFEAIGTGVSYVGPIGSGTVAKLVHNSITLTTRVVVQEGMTLAVKAGVKPSVMLQVLWDAAFGKQTLLKQIPGTVFTGDFETPRFSLRLAHKDVSLGQDPRAGDGRADGAGGDGEAGDGGGHQPGVGRVGQSRDVHAGGGARRHRGARVNDLVRMTAREAVRRLAARGRCRRWS